MTEGATCSQSECMPQPKRPITTSATNTRARGNSNCFRRPPAAEAGFFPDDFLFALTRAIATPPCVALDDNYPSDYQISNSVSNSTPSRSATRLRIMSIKRSTSWLVAPSWAMMKLAWRWLTSTSPTRVPFKPA